MNLLSAHDDAKNPTAAPELPPAEEQGEEQERTVEEGQPEEPLEDPGAGYQGAKASDEERRRMFDDPKLRGELRRAVARKIPASDVDDVAQNAMLSAFRAPGLPAGDGPDRDRYVMGTARNEVKMYWRGRKTQRDIKDTIKIGRVVQAVELDRLEIRDMFARVKLPGGRWDDFRCLMRHKLQKVPLVTLAAERGEDYDTFAKRMSRLEKTIRVQMSGSAPSPRWCSVSSSSSEPRSRPRWRWTCRVPWPPPRPPSPRRRPRAIRSTRRGRCVVRRTAPASTSTGGPARRCWTSRRRSIRPATATRSSRRRAATHRGASRAN